MEGVDSSSQGNMNEYYAKLDKMTVDDILASTPANTSVLTDARGCTIRLPGKFAAKYPYSTAQECYRLFKIKKYIHRDLICYSFDPIVIKNSTKLAVGEYSLSPQAAGIIYRLFLNKNLFQNVTRYTAMAHSHKTSRLYDAGFSHMMYRELGNSSVDQFLNLGITFQSVSLTRLRSPYDTDCKSCPPYTTCADLDIIRMRNETINQFKRVPTFDAVSGKINFPLLTAMPSPE